MQELVQGRYSNHANSLPWQRPSRTDSRGYPVEVLPGMRRASQPQGESQLTIACRQLGPAFASRANREPRAGKIELRQRTVSLCPRIPPRGDREGEGCKLLRSGGPVPTRAGSPAVPRPRHRTWRSPSRSIRMGTSIEKAATRKWPEPQQGSRMRNSPRCSGQASNAPAAGRHPDCLVVSVTLHEAQVVERHSRELPPSAAIRLRWRLLSDRMSSGAVPPTKRPGSCRAGTAPCRAR